MESNNGSDDVNGDGREGTTVPTSETAGSTCGTDSCYSVFRTGFLPTTVATALSASAYSHPLIHVAT